MSWYQKIIAMNRTVMGINQRNVELIYPHNRKADYHLADDKIITKTILKKHHLACAETYAIIERIGDISKVWANIGPYEKIAIKPANGRGGGGIKILKQQDGKWFSSGKEITEAQLFKHFADILMGVYSLSSNDRVLIEYCIEPHPFFHEIYPAGVPDFRVILLHGIPILSMLRVPTDRSNGKANLHQGGLGIGIDMDSGQLKKGFDGQHYYKNHPDSDQLIQGRQIPLWKETLNLAINTSKAFPLDYLGIDIVLDQQLGPLVMEINVRPGLGIQMVNQTGLQDAVRKHPTFATVLSSPL